MGNNSADALYALLLALLIGLSTYILTFWLESPLEKTTKQFFYKKYLNIEEIK